MRLIVELARANNVDPIDLDPPLGTVVDMDAIDALFDGDSAENVTVSFDYEGRRITMHEDGISLDPMSDRSGEPRR